MINKIGKRKQQGRFICAAPLKQCSSKSSLYDNKNVVTLYRKVADHILKRTTRSFFYWLWNSLNSMLMALNYLNDEISFIVKVSCKIIHNGLWRLCVSWANFTARVSDVSQFGGSWRGFLVKELYFWHLIVVMADIWADFEKKIKTRLIDKKAWKNAGRENTGPPRSVIEQREKNCRIQKWSSDDFTGLSSQEYW